MPEPNRDGIIQALGLTSREVEQLTVYADRLAKWSNVKNLVSANTLPHIWSRHFFDSAQVQRALPEAIVWLDFGSGAGFPGLVTAILLSGRGGLVHLVESDHRKCAFLRDVSRETGVNTKVHCRRIEEIATTILGVEAVSARAVASLPQLLGWSEPLLKRGALGVFPKGREVEDELTRIADIDRFEINLRPSLTHEEGRLVLVRMRP